MANLIMIKTDGSLRVIRAKGSVLDTFQCHMSTFPDCEELNTIKCSSPLYLLADENGLFNGSRINKMATLALRMKGVPVMGDAMICRYENGELVPFADTAEGNEELGSVVEHLQAIRKTLELHKQL